MDPFIAHLQTLLAAGATGLHFANLCYMTANSRLHIFPFSSERGIRGQTTEFPAPALRIYPFMVQMFSYEPICNYPY